MVEYAKILNYAIPFFIILIGIEYTFSILKNQKVIRLFDTISSLSSGMTNVVKDILGLSIVIISYSWLVDHLALFSIETTVLLYIIAFIGLDFAGYWSHRFSHEINIFWNRHIIHHSSEEFNLSCALRQSVSEIFAIFTFLFIPMAIVGVPAKVVAIVAPLHLFAQFWYHTQLINKLGFLEYIIVTPSHHRVHHAINPKYMDKNYSQIFIFWDRLFGTFQEELPEEKPIYGVTRQVNTWNPWLINFQHFWLLVQDAWHTKNTWDKFRIWFMPTGWRPLDIKDKYASQYKMDYTTRIKYDTHSTPAVSFFIIGQWLVTFLAMIYFFNIIGTLSSTYLLLYGFYIFISIFAFTSLMDGSPLSILGESIRFIVFISIFYYQNYNWFTLDKVIPYSNSIFFYYHIISLIFTITIYIYSKPVNSKPLSDDFNLGNTQL